MPIKFVTIAALLLLTACGGGGGAGEGNVGTDSSINQAPSPEKDKGVGGAPDPSPAPIPPPEPVPQPVPAPQPINPGPFAAAVQQAPADNSTVSGIVRLEVQGSNLQNVELLPDTGYTPIFGVFVINPERTRAVFDWDTRGAPNGARRFRISAFNAPAGSANASEIVAMPARSWTISNASTTPAPTNDPLFAQQWHLKNTGQIGRAGPGAALGEDINVEPVWQTCTDGSCGGQGVTVAVVDSGVEIAHPDLAPNVSSVLQHRTYSASGVGSNGDPTPDQGGISESSASHGTMVAGIIASRDANGLGGRGVAPRSNIVGYGMSYGFTQMGIVDALRFQAEQIGASNNSYGPTSFNHPTYMSGLVAQSINEGLLVGRSGQGTVYVFSNGNGGNYGERSTYDEMASYRGVIAVASVNAQGQKATYSERGANIWVSAPGGEYCGTGLTITTTDLMFGRGVNNGTSDFDLVDADFTQCMNGTSAAAPVVTGVVALMLQANPRLNWRDVRYILARTARRNHSTDAGWVQNGAGRLIHDSYGFGVVNAKAAVDMARTWSNLPALRPTVSGTQTLNRVIPDNSSQSVTGALNISGSAINQIEWVDVTFSASDHSYSGDLEITLISPSGTRLPLATPRVCYVQPPNQSVECTRYAGFRFGVAHLLDEPADGQWQLVVRDGGADDTGTFQSWSLTLYGR